jgi:glyceraldehyde 3-phosphate dehydrogenase
LASPVGHVVISANAPDADFTACVGLNHQLLDRRQHRVISNASCTTNCIAPVAATLHRAIGLARGLMTTVHAYTAGQELVDSVRPGSNPRYARAAGVNLIPAATGAALAVGLVVPELAGRLDGQAVRVPVANVSMVELVAELERPTSIAELERVFRAAAGEGPLVGLLGVTDEPWVSSDALADSRSAIVDLGLLQLIGDRLARVVAWYDNEWGYANRLADLIAYLGGHDETANSR